MKIRKFWDLQNLLHLRTFRMWGNLQICDLRTQYFCDLRICDLLTQIYYGPTTSANLKILYFSANKHLKFSNSNQCCGSGSQIHMFLGLLDPDPDPLVRGMDPDLDLDPAPDPDPSITQQNY
jgi:hypothetical protein